MEGCSLFLPTVEYICNELANTGRHTHTHTHMEKMKMEEEKGNQTRQDEHEVLYDESNDSTATAPAG